MASFIPKRNVERFGERVARELTPQLGEFEPTASRLRTVRELALKAKFCTDLDWGMKLPHPDVSAELLEVAMDSSAAIEWLGAKLTVDDIYGCWALPLPAEYDKKGRARYPTLTSSRYAANGELAHRFVIRRLYGPLQTEEYLDHLCRVHACCNPTHLDIVSHTTNTRRGNLARRAIAGQLKLF